MTNGNKHERLSSQMEVVNIQNKLTYTVSHQASYKHTHTHPHKCAYSLRHRHTSHNMAHNNAICEYHVEAPRLSIQKREGLCTANENTGRTRHNLDFKGKFSSSWIYGKPLHVHNEMNSLHTNIRNLKQWCNGSGQSHTRPSECNWNKFHSAIHGNKDMKRLLCMYMFTYSVSIALVTALVQNLH
jgi:hypothetical protein